MSSKYFKFFLVCLASSISIITSVTSCYVDCNNFPTKYIGQKAEKIKHFGQRSKEVYTFVSRKNSSNELLQLKWNIFLTADRMPFCYHNYVKIELG